jgi:L-serine deaminase
MTDQELQAWAARMSEALEEIAEAMTDCIESGGEPEYTPTPERIRGIATRALDPAEWERAA